MHFGLMSLGDHMPDPHTGGVMTGTQRHRMLVEAGVIADQCGFTSFNVGEHHGVACITSSPPVILSAIAERTDRIQLGTAVALLANLDPLRLAEDYATLDALSGGRVDLVVGRGSFFVSTYTLFGQDITDSHALFEENLELLLELWRGEPVHWVGKFRPPINGEALKPAPVQSPHAPVWVGGGSSTETAVLAGRLGLKLMLPSAFGAPAGFRRVVDEYLGSFEPRAPGQGPRIGGCWHLNVAPTSQQARAKWEPRYRAYQGWMQELLKSSNPELPDYLLKPFDFEWLTEVGPAIVGSPEEVVDRLSSLADLLDLDTHLLKMDLGGMPEMEYLAMIELFGSDVLPQLQQS